MQTGLPVLALLVHMITPVSIMFFVAISWRPGLSFVRADKAAWRPFVPWQAEFE
jgi:hypothetical protein